jgi:ligand-binding SRPBCC domain-containing protein
MGIYQLQKKQLLPSTIDNVWEFISTPANLKEITPPYMGFDIVSKNLPPKMYTGMIIVYKVKPFPGIPVTWVTEITHLVERSFFIDVQRVGPYAFWHHQHIIEQHNEGVLMTDIISYKPPLGFFGNIANSFFIGKQLDAIFAYREKVLQKVFGHVP